MKNRLIALFISLFISLTLIFSLLTLPSCTQIQRSKSYSFITSFDTVVTVEAFMDEYRFAIFYTDVEKALVKYHKYYDIYHEYSGINNLCTVNLNAGIAPVSVDREIIDLLLFAKEWHEKSGGALNVAMGGVFALWHEYRTNGNGILPPYADLQDTALHTDINAIVIDEENSTVFITDERVRLDAGAIAKGYAVEQVASLALNRGYTSFLINAGGDIKTVGKSKLSDGLWRVGITNPDPAAEDPYLQIFELSDTSVMTSGDYERYYTVDGQRYSHIIDPATLYPSDKYRSVTVICSDSGIADALSTILFILEKDAGMNLLLEIDGAEAFYY